VLPSRRSARVHDAKYGKMLLDWKQEITKQERHRRGARGGEGVRRPHEKAGREVSKEEALSAGGRELPGGLAGRGVHNHKLSREMLRAAKADLDKVLSAKTPE